MIKNFFFSKNRMKKYSKKIEKEKLFIPKNIAIIPDGNRRWAKKNKIGLENLYEVVSKNVIKNMDFFEEIIKDNKNEKYNLSFWAFSTDNWKRKKKEIESVFFAIEKLLDDILESKLYQKFIFNHFGKEDKISKVILSKIKKIEKLSKANQNKKNFVLNLVLDYGGRDEMIRAIKKIPKNKISKLNEDNFKKYLDTSKEKTFKDIDLIIRTSGEKRLSGYFLYQSQYSELYFTDKFFPELNEKEFYLAIKDFNKRKRRFGGN